MFTGSCMCGQVRYEVHGEVGAITHCHCPTCRKAHAAAFSSVAPVQLDGLRLTAGESLLKYYESSVGKRRYFCSNCGSHIYARREGQGHLILRMGTVDGDPGIRPACHIFTRYMAPWYDIHDNLPEHLEWPLQTGAGRTSVSAEFQQLYATMEAVLTLAARKGASTSLLLVMMDLCEGQQQQLMELVQHKILMNVRDSDTIQPVGERRFAVLLPYTDAKASMILAQRIRNAIKDSGPLQAISASIGAATLGSAQLSAEAMVRNIDQVIASAELACRASQDLGGDKVTHCDSLK